MGPSQTTKITMAKVIKKTKLDETKSKQKFSIVEGNKSKRKIKNIIKVNHSHGDLRKIRHLLFMGIVLILKEKDEFKYKVWVCGFSHLFAIARTPVSAYRRMFKLLRRKGIYIP